ncbi:MAG: Tfp pilus assembly protein FimT/FimU, partial [Sutterella sp.]
GFTLIEIVCVLILVGILGAVAVPKYFDLSAEAELRAVSATASEIQARLETVFAHKVLEGASCTESLSYAAELKNFSDREGAAVFGEFEFEPATVAADGTALRYRRAGSSDEFKAIAGFALVLPACVGEVPSVSALPLSNSVGAELYRSVLAGPQSMTDGRVDNDSGWEFSTHKYQDATGGSSGLYWYHSNVDWSTASDGQPTIKVRFGADGSLAAVYYSEYPDQAGGTPGYHIDNLLLQSPESGSSVTAEERAQYIDAFKQNFPDYETFFRIAASPSGYLYLEVLEAGQPTVQPSFVPGSSVSPGGRS